MEIVINLSSVIVSRWFSLFMFSPPRFNKSGETKIGGKSYKSLCYYTLGYILRLWGVVKSYKDK